MTLGDAFNRRKKLDSDIAIWLQRLGQAGVDRREYRTKSIEGNDAFVPEPGSEKITKRVYTIEECKKKLQELLKEDEELALRISITNQNAKAEVQLLDGTVKQLTIPELLVLKNEIIPKMENIARATPIRATGVNIFEEKDDYFVKHRTVTKIEKKKETLMEKGLKVEEVTIEGYNVVETTDYGILSRKVWDEIDKIQEFAQRVKQAINECNKTELLPLNK